MPSDSVRIYIAGPYSQGNITENLREAITMGDILFSLGFYPYIPHLTHYWHQIYPRSWDEWMKQDLVFLELCQGLLRIPGESKGADKEAEIATQLGIPVYYSLEELIRRTNESQ